MAVVSTTLENKLKKDKRVQESMNRQKELRKSKSSFKNGEPEDVIEKVLKYQDKRSSASSINRTGELLSDAQFKLSNIRLNNQAYRSNIVTMKSRLAVIKGQLESEIKIIKKYISAVYLILLKDMGYTTKTDRDYWVDNYFYKTVSLISRLDTAIKTCDIVIDDIDNQAFAVKDIVNMFNVEFKYKDKE